MTSPTPPSVGRIVHYLRLEGPVEEGQEPVYEDLAAIITRVDDPVAQTVTLAVFRPGVGTNMPETVPYSESTTPDTWHWPEQVA